MNRPTAVIPITALSQMRRYIDLHLHLALDIDQLARVAGYSPYHFLRRFKQIYRQTPYQYLTVRRIEKAKAMLLDSDDAVTEVCFAVGFHSLGSFSTLFLRHVGKSPAAFRAQARRCPPAIPQCYLQMATRMQDSNSQETRGHRPDIILG